MYVTYRKVSVADEEMTCRQEAGWYRGIDMIVPLHVLCEGIFLLGFKPVQHSGVSQKRNGTLMNK